MFRLYSEVPAEVLSRRSGVAAGTAAAGAPTAAMDPKAANKHRNLARDAAKAAKDFTGPVPEPPQTAGAPEAAAATAGA